MKNLRSLMPENWGLLLAAFASAYGVGLLALLALPFLVSAVINDLHLDEAQAGLLMSAEFLFTMVSSLLVAPAMGRAPRRTLALAGAVVAIAANVVSASIQDIYLLATVRCIAGVGAGLCLACGNACVSSAQRPDRIAGHMNILFVALMIGVMLGFSSTMTRYGLAGLYYATAITQAAMLLFILPMPQRPAIVHAEQHEAGSARSLFSGTALCMMMTMFLFSARDTMGWAFVERVGVKVGYDSEALGLLFSLQAFVGLVGPLLAALIGGRFGLGKPVVIGILLTGAVSLGYVLGEHSVAMYTVSVMLIAMTYFYALAYLTALAAALDRQGRIAAAAGSFLTLGIAVGPAVSGMLVASGGYTYVGWGIALIVLLTLLFALVPLGAFREQHRRAAQVPAYTPY
ncbi:MAG: MFS transporter [Burkholderiaceae bacterium]|nr:MFS transporter [Burkholderiaceae bacterium]